MNFELFRRRADLLDRLRQFFRDRGFLEVETPLASSEAIPERHIELRAADGGRQWLQASPEMHHKRLLCCGSGPIFEVTKSFRGNERGAHHNPEFTLVEWYRPGDDMTGGMALLEDLLGALLDTRPAAKVAYREAFVSAVGIDPFAATTERLRSEARAATGITFAGETDRDEFLNALLSSRVEPTLGAEAPAFLYHYPSSQAALAATTNDDRGERVAERFELYYRGVELANGYHELTDASELRRRLEIENERRLALGKAPTPMPEQLLTDMETLGLPPCAGVALGFDRLVMLATGADSIAEVRLFSETS